MSERIQIEENKFCFIICSNNSLFLEECLFYISRLEIPRGYEVETISIGEAKSMTAGYNEGMRASNAKYKIYLHQDVFIVYPGFLQSVLDIFKSDETIGMIGMVGAPKMSVNGVMWNDYRQGALYGVSPERVKKDSYKYRITDGLYEVEAIDGLMMITSADLYWRQDLFDGWDFYDVSQSLEFNRKGYKVVVPEQHFPWCRHEDGGIMNLANYDKYRKICMEEYREYFYPEKFTVGKAKVNADIAALKKKEYMTVIVANQWNLLNETLESLNQFSNMNSSQIIIVDNGSRDGMSYWLKRQKDYNYIICGEITEGYSAILNEVIEQFVEEENLFVLTAGLTILPGCVRNLNQALNKNPKTGAVFGKNIAYGFRNISDAIRYSQRLMKKGTAKKAAKLPFQGVLLSNKILKQSKGFEEKLFLPQEVLEEYSVRKSENQYEYYEVSNALFYQTEDGSGYRQ